MMEGWKKWYIVIAVVFIVTAIAGKIIHTQAPDAGLAEVDQLEDLLSLPVELEYPPGRRGRYHCASREYRKTSVYDWHIWSRDSSFFCNKGK